MKNKPAIGIYETFKVSFKKGIDNMQYPGDPTASADNIVNCRCTHAVVPLEDEFGLPILKSV